VIQSSPNAWIHQKWHSNAVSINIYTIIAGCPPQVKLQ